MPDTYLVLAPILLLPVVALLRFIGCHLVFSLDEVEIESVPVVAVNCGGGALADDVGSWQADADDGGSSGDRFMSTGGSPFTPVPTPSITNQQGGAVSAVYGTCRFGSDVSYTFTVPEQGDYELTLKFAEISPQGGGRVFNFNITGDGGNTTQGRTNYDITATAGGDFITQDETFQVTADAAQTITVHFVQGPANLPLINAIQIIKRV